MFANRCLPRKMLGRLQVKRLHLSARFHSDPYSDNIWIGRLSSSSRQALKSVPKERPAEAFKGCTNLDKPKDNAKTYRCVAVYGLFELPFKVQPIPIGH